MLEEVRFARQIHLAIDRSIVRRRSSYSQSL